jgi:UDP-glucuronate decarboxylase
VVSNFIVQALRGDPLTLYGRGEQTRAFCFVDDLVDALVRLMASDSCPSPVNLGNPDEVSIRTLAELIRELTGSESPIEYRPLPADDPVQRRPDISRAERNLGWRPQRPLRDGLTETISFFRRSLAA